MPIPRASAASTIRRVKAMSSAEGEGSPLSRPATLVDVGGYYKFHDPGFQLLFCYGHSALGPSENYGYLGLYWTWGKKKPDDPAGAAFNGGAHAGLMRRI